MKIFSVIIALFLTPILFKIDIYQTKSNDVVLLGYGVNQSVGQTFTAKHNNIYNIKILVNNSNLEYKQPVIFSIKNSPSDNTDLRQIKFSGENIGSNYWLPIKFPPLPDSKDKMYYFELRVDPQSSKNFEVRRSKTDTYRYGNAYVNKQESNGDFSFKVYYKVNIIEYFSSIFSDLYAKITEDRQFFMFYLSLVTLICIFLLYEVFLK
jgi:hypothetical protein